MRIIDFFDGSESETTPTIGNILASGIIQYASDAEYEAAELDAPAEGNIYYNTTDDVLRYFDAAGEGAWRTILSDDDLAGILEAIQDVEDRVDLVEADITDIETDISNLQNSLSTLEINDLADVTAPAPDSGDVLVFDGEGWVSQPGAFDAEDISFDPTGNSLISENVQAAIVENRIYSEAVDSDLVNHVNDAANPHSTSVSNLNDTVITTPQPGEVLSWNGSEWINEAVTGGTGTGSKNYFDAESADFEGGTTGGWAANDVGLTITATNAVGEVLAGTRSLKLVKSDSDLNDKYITVETNTIDLVDRGKILFGSFGFKSISGYVSGDLRIEVWDQTNSALLYSGPLSDREILASSEGFKVNYVTYLDQTTAVVELRLVVNNTNTNTFTVVFDEFKLGPASILPATFERYEEIDVSSDANFTAGVIAVGRTGNQVSVKVKTQVIHASLNDVSSASPHVPTWARPEVSEDNVEFLAGSAPGQLHRFLVNPDGTFSFRYRNADTGGLISRTGSGTSMAVSYTVPSTPFTMTTNELGLQTGAFRASRNGTNQTGVNPNASSAKILMNSVAGPNDYVRGLTYDTANSRFVNNGPAGVFRFDAAISVAGANVLAARYRAELAISGLSTIIGQTVTAAAGLAHIFTVSGQAFLPNGATVELQLWGAGNNSSSTLTVSGAGTTFFAGQRTPDLTLIGAVRNDEYYEDTNDTSVSWPFSGATWGDVVSRTLEPGEWELSGGVMAITTGLPGGNRELQAAITSTPGNSTTGMIPGLNRHANIIPDNNGILVSAAVPKHRVFITTPTTYYLKSRISTATNINKFGHGFQARRIK